MKKKINIDIKKNINLLLFYFLTSLILTSLFNGFETLNFVNTKWLFQGDDRSQHQIGWYFFKNDIWRFPLGANPNFGDAIGNSIIYSDSIPIFALIFKLINFILPEKFQYFSIWFTLCFFLQGVLSFFLINKIIKNRQISIICSFFFLIFPPALYRIDWHPALFGHWVLILAIIFIFEKKYNKNIYWTLLTLLTSLIHFYFTIIVLIIFNLINLLNLTSKKISFKKYFLSIFICHISLIILMYIVGYFEVRVVDTLALGFGIYKLNLLSIFDSTNSPLGVSWSWLLPDLKLSAGEELEGFNFPGLGVLLLFFYGIYIFLKNKNLKLSVNKYIDKSFYISLIIFFLLSLSNNISLGKINVIQIPLSDYLYGLFSIIRSTGRLFWVISYFLLFYFIFIIYFKFKKNSLFIFSLLLLVQLFDSSIALTNRNNNFYGDAIKDDFWFTKEILMLKEIITTSPVAYNSHFDKFAYYIEENNIKYTNIIKLARTDRNKVANNRYRLLENFYKKKLDNGSIYVIDNIGHLLVLKQIFQNEDVGFFFRDNMWIMIKNKKKLMNEKDINLFNNLSFYNLEFNKVEKAEKNDKNFYIGFGWSHNNNNEGMWSEGKISNLIFELDTKQKNINFNGQIIPFINEKNKELNIDVFVNGKFNNYLEFKYDNKLSNQKNINFKIKNENILDNIINIEFKNRNPVSPYDIFLSPDSRKLGFLLLNFNFSID